MLEQNGSKWFLYHELGPRPEDPRMTGALFEKCSASLRLKVLFIYFYLEMIGTDERGVQRVIK